MLLSQFNRDLVHRRCIVKIGDEARVEKILGQNGLRKLRENLFVSLVNNSPDAAANSPKEETPPAERPDSPVAEDADAFPPPGKAVSELPEAADNREEEEELIDPELLPAQGSISPSSKTVVLNHWSENIALDKWGNPVPINQARGGVGRGRGSGRGGIRGGGVRGGGRSRGRGRGKRQQPPPVAAFFRAAGGVVRPRLRLRVTVSEGRYAVRDVSPDGADDSVCGGGGGESERAQGPPRKRERPTNQPHVRAQVLAPLDATAAAGALLLAPADEAEYGGGGECEQKDDYASEPQQEREVEEQPLTKVKSPRPPPTTTSALTGTTTSTSTTAITPAPPHQTQVGKREEVPERLREEDFFAKPKGIDLAGLVAETIGDPESAVLSAPSTPARPVSSLVGDSLLPELTRDEEGAKTLNEDKGPTKTEKGVEDKYGEAVVRDKYSTSPAVESGGSEKSGAKSRGGSNNSETPVETKTEAAGQSSNAQADNSNSSRVEKHSDKPEEKASDAKEEVKSEVIAPKEEVVEDDEDLPEEELDPLWISNSEPESPSSPDSIKIISSEEEAEDDKPADKGKKTTPVQSVPTAKNVEPRRGVEEVSKSSTDDEVKLVEKAAPEKKPASTEDREHSAGSLSSEREAGQPVTEEDKTQTQSGTKTSAPSPSGKRDEVPDKADDATIGKDIAAPLPSGPEEVVAKPVCPKEAQPIDGGGDVADSERAELKSTATEAQEEKEAVKEGGANEVPAEEVKQEDALAKKPPTCEDNKTKTAAAEKPKDKNSAESAAATSETLSTFEGVKKAAAAEAWQSLADRIAVKAALKRVIHQVEMRVGSKYHDGATAAAVAAAAGGGVPTVPTAAAAKVPPATPPPKTVTPPTSPPSKPLHQLPPTSPSPNKSYSTKPGPASKKFVPRKRKRKCFRSKRFQSNMAVQSRAGERVMSGLFSNSFF